MAKEFSMEVDPAAADDQRDKGTGRWTRGVVLGALLVYTAVFLALYSRAKFFWGDEVLTFYSVHGRTLRQLIEFQSSTPIVLEPPANEVLVWSFAKVLGCSPWVLRLPSTLLFVFLEWLVFRIAELLGGFRAGVVAAVLLTGSLIVSYGAEARPYALLTALTACALLLWALAKSNRSRRAAVLVLLAIVVALATVSQFYGAMIVLPLLIAELTLSFHERHAPDWGVIGAGVAGLCALLIDLPYMRGVHLYQSHLGVHGSFGVKEFFATYDWGFAAAGGLHWHAHALWFWSAPILLLAIAGSYPASVEAPSSGPRTGVRRGLWAALVTLMLYPVPNLLIARFVIHTYAPRYAIQCIVGLVVLLAVTLARVLARIPRSYVPAVAVLGCLMLVVRDWRLVRGQRWTKDSMLVTYAVSPPVRSLIAQDPQRPIYLTIDECLLYPFYGDQTYMNRIRCLYSVPLEERYSRSLMSSTTALVLANRTDFPIPVSSYAVMKANGTAMLAYHELQWLTWIPAAMKADGAVAAPIGSGFGGEVFALQYPAAH